MRTDVRLGSVRGVEVGLNQSWLIVFGLVTWSLAREVFPATVAGLSTETYVAMALVAALLYFASLLLHELGHALQARREGMGVSGITLWALGGVARFTGTFPSAGAEFRVAFAGPLVSLLLGVAFVAAASLLALPEQIDSVVAWVGWMNLLLFAFNMLPALPLDGGRVLHSILWKARGSLSWATDVAARIGVLIGQLMVFGGVVLAFTEDVVSGIWLVLVGWFVMSAARSEAEMTGSREALSGLRVSDAMVRHPETVRGNQTLRDVVDHVFGARRHAAYPVVDDGRVLGLLSSRTVTSVPYAVWTRRRVREHMIPAERALAVTGDDDLAEAAAALVQTGLQRALVLHDGRLAGLLSVTDVRRILEQRRHRRDRQVQRGWRDR